MKIAKLTLQPLRIPFRVAFRHASAVRDVTQSFLVVAGSEAGNIGYGEGCPRQYVTGETDTSVVRFFEDKSRELMEQVRDLPSLLEWGKTHEQEINQNPAAWCALEMAILDLLGRDCQQPVEALLGLPPLAGPFVYSAVLGAAEGKQFSATLEKYQRIGMQDFKIKLSGDMEQDRESVAILRAAGVLPVQVRADANNLWNDWAIASDYLGSLEFPFKAVEEPLKPGQFADLARLADALSTRIVLDESVTRAEHLHCLTGDAARWIVNIRVSKMGGLVRSLQVLQACRQMGLAIVVGAQVGETSLLTRAALVVAQTARDILLAQEGAYGTFLLQTDVAEPVLMFGNKGELDAPFTELALEAGLGLSVTPEFAPV